MCFDFKEGHSYSNYSNWAMKKCWWFRVYRRLYYPVIWGLYLGSFSWLNCLSRVPQDFSSFLRCFSRDRTLLYIALSVGWSHRWKVWNPQGSEDCTVQMSIFLLKVVGLVRFVNKLSLDRERETQFGKEVLKDFQSLSHFNFFKSRLEDPPSSGVRHSNVQNRGSEELFFPQTREVFRKSKPESRITVWRWPKFHEKSAWILMIQKTVPPMWVVSNKMLKDKLLLVSYHILELHGVLIWDASVLQALEFKFFLWRFSRRISSWRSQAPQRRSINRTSEAKRKGQDAWAAFTLTKNGSRMVFIFRF